MLSVVHPELTPPNWDNLVGGSVEADWLADRDRKINLILGLSSDVLQTAAALNADGAAFRPTPEILRKYRFAIDWYVSLAGFSLKTLNYMVEGPRKYRIKRKVRGLRDSLANGAAVDPDELAKFAKWLQDQIDHVWPIKQRTVDRATVVVSAILGGRAIGQGQNAGGNDAVVLLKEAIASYAERHRLTLEGGHEGSWSPNSAVSPSLLEPSLRVDGKLVCIFPTGGDTPDVIFRVASRTDPVAVGEVKGRKDISNVWESWMPQVVDHMYTWSREFPKSLRLFFGTLITAPMIEGESVRGTERRGLRGLYEEGSLNGVYNLSKLAQGDAFALASFEELMRVLRNA